MRIRVFAASAFMPFRRVLLSLGTLLLLSVHLAFGQSDIPTDGFMPSHDYVSSPIDTVDLDTNALLINIPIVSYKQRGLLPDFTFQVRYNSPTNWTSVDEWWETPGTPVDEPPEYINYPYWTFTGAGIEVVRGDTLTLGIFSQQTDNEGGSQQDYTVSEDYAQDGTGTQHLLYSPTNGGLSRTMDGSGIAVNDNGALVTSTGVQHMAGYTSSSFDTVSDPFGNSITPITRNALGEPNYVVVDHWIDSLNRNIPSLLSSLDLSPGWNGGCFTYNLPADNNSTAPYTFCYSMINVGSNFQLPNIEEGAARLFTLTSLHLPNGTAYTFHFDTWGELSGIDLPSGGHVTYTWATSATRSTGTRILASRIIDPGDGTAVRTWYYCPGAGTSVCDTQFLSQIDPDGNETTRDTTTLTTTHYQGSATSGTVLEKEKTTLCSEPNVLWNSPVTEPLPVCQVDTTLSDGEVITKKFTYDTPIEVTSTAYNDPRFTYTGYKAMEIAKSQSVSVLSPAASGPVVQTTSTQYLWESNSSYFQANLLSTPHQVTIADANGSPVSQVTYGYDETGSPQGVYGLQTSVTKSGGNGGLYIKTSAAYNSQGMVSDTYDANYNAGSLGTHVNITYDSTGVFPWKITQSPTPNANHVDYYSYDSNTGAMNWHTDQNGTSAGDANHTTFWTYDNLGRATSVSYPDGGGSKYCYTDVGGAICSATAAPYSAYTTTQMSATTNMTSSVSYNGLGETVQKTDPSGAITAIQYDGLGRVKAVSNPFMGPGPPSEWTTINYDALGRKTLVTEPDSNALHWQYTGPTVDSWDENGTHMQHTSDALGRLVKVMELGTSTSPFSLETDYQYDALGNLRNVNHAGQTRTFTYDSLSRLITSTNPETGTICYGTWSNGTCQAGYDANGNLLHKTDANLTTLSYTYDALNRMVQESGPGSPAVLNVFQYDTEPTGSALATPSNSTGRLVWSTNAIDSDSYNAYDAMGRLISWIGCRPHDCPGSRTISAQYDLAGNLTQLTYPDGRVIQQLFDNAGRLNQINDITPGHTNATLWTANSFWPSGQPHRVTLGNGVTEDFEQNSRLQISALSANSPLLPSNSGHGNIYDKSLYYSSPNNGNIQAILDNIQTNNTQSFQYDGLNRLIQASRNDGAYNQNYNYDSFGNMLKHDVINGDLNFSIDPTTNRLLLNTTDLQYDPSGRLTSDPLNRYGYIATGLLSSLNGGSSPWSNYAGSNQSYFSYTSEGQRSAKNTPYGLTDYYYFGSDNNPISDISSFATDYIYANGQKIATVAQNQNLLTFSATAGQTGLDEWATITPSGASFQPGDTLVWRQRQSGNGHGGMIVLLDNGASSVWSLNDTNGVMSNSDTSTPAGQWNSRVLALNPLCPSGSCHYSLVLIGADQASTGQFTIDFADISIVHADGSVIPLFNNSASSPASIQGGNMSGASAAVTTQPGDAGSVHYYLSDHLGSTQMELGSAGWPVWEGQFTPFGQEIVNQATLLPGSPDGTNMRFKFTGKERDAESGLDYFGARYYGSGVGRFMSPDDYGGHLADPQTLNKYVYARNNPLIYVDPDGHDFNLTGCGKDSSTCQNNMVGTTSTDANGKSSFTATVISNDKNGNLVDQAGNQYSGTVTSSGVSFSQNGSNTSYGGSWVNGSNETSFTQSGGALNGFSFTFTQPNTATGQRLAGEFSFQGDLGQAGRALGNAGFSPSTIDRFLNPLHGIGDHYRGGGDPKTGEGSAHFIVSLGEMFMDGMSVPSNPGVYGGFHYGETDPNKNFYQHVTKEVLPWFKNLVTPH